MKPNSFIIYCKCWRSCSVFRLTGGLVRNGDPDIVVAAIEATTQLLAKGSSFERKKLFDADVFPVALELHNRRSQREQSLKLLNAIVSHLSYEILNDNHLAIKMLSLFEWVNYFFPPISY